MVSQVQSQEETGEKLRKTEFIIFTAPGDTVYHPVPHGETAE